MKRLVMGLATVCAAAICAAADFNVREYGAKPEADAAANRTAIQKAMDAAAAAGGGRVVVPAGTWRTGTIELRSHVELHLDRGALVVGGTKASDYNRDDVFPENFHSVGEEWSGGHLILGYKVEDVAITGEGTFDGNGPAFFGEPEYDSWFPSYKYGLKLHPIDRDWYRPGPMLAIFLSKNIRFEGVTFRNTPCWTLHVRCCDGFTAKGVTIDADRTIANSDGFSIDCTKNVLIEKCTIKTGDDGFAIRASCRHHAASNFCENIRVRDCDVWSCCLGVRFGVGTGTIRNVSFENCRFHESCDAVCYTPAWVGVTKNVYIEDTHFKNCFMGECIRPVNMWLPQADALVKNATFEDCEFETLLPCWVGGNAKGRVENVRLTRCTRKPLDAIKVKSNLRWLNENRKAMRQKADLVAEIGEAKDVVVEKCLPERGKPSGVLVLSFDDRNFAGWEKAMPLFDKYGAHATFFVHGEINNDVVRTMKKLRAHGHSIGIHGLRHENAPDAIAAKGAENYYRDEIERQRRTCQVSYVPVSSFAYPNCRRTEETDRLFFSWGFERVRGGLPLRPYDPEGKRRAELKPLATDDRQFFPAAELPKRRLLNCTLLGEAYNTDIDDVVACVRRAGERREALVLASHDIGPDAKHINMKTEWLEKILAAAKESGVRVLGFDELPIPEDVN